MTAQPHQSEFDVSQIAGFAMARSDWLNRFSKLEVAVMKCAHRFCAEHLPRGMPFCQRLNEFSSLKPSSACSARTVKKLQELARECSGFLPRRATIVHSVMKMGKRDGVDAALFQNGVDAAADLPNYLIMTEEDFLADRRALQSMADRFSDLLTSPSSPPPPKPAAAAGP